MNKIDRDVWENRLLIVFLWYLIYSALTTIVILWVNVSIVIGLVILEVIFIVNEIEWWFKE